MTMTRTLALIFSVVCLACAPARAEDAAAKQERCRVDSLVRSFLQELPNARKAVQEGKSLTIVALGSSSTAGTGASSQDNSYPSLLQGELTRRFPGIEVSVINRGVGGNSAVQMLHRIPDEVLAEEPNLVIWQTGVNDAIYDIGIDKFKRILRKGSLRSKRRKWM